MHQKTPTSHEDIRYINLYTEPGIEATACARELLYVYVYVYVYEGMSELCNVGAHVKDFKQLTAIGDRRVTIAEFRQQQLSPHSGPRSTRAAKKLGF